MAAIKLFCLPYAGGAAEVYNKWKPYLDCTIELHPIELAGRGKRYDESFYKDFEEMILDILSIIRANIEGTKYIFYGHSMGCAIAFELSQRLQEMGLCGPEHIFLSGRCPPHIKKNRNVYGDLTDKELKRKLIKLGGISEEVLRYECIIDYFLPILKADLRVTETYDYTERNERLDCEITVINGVKDELISNMNEWGRYTKNDFSIYNFEGGHFFINENIKGIVEIINSKLARVKIQESK